MRYAIISDIHSNLEAFNAVIKAVDLSGIDRIICLGDIVGYNANPNECVDIVKNRNITSVMGNHDSRAACIEEPFDFNPAARKAIYWTRERLSKKSISFLKSLPERISIENSIGIHGSIDDKDRYILSHQDAYENFMLLKDVPKKPIICFFGHTHLPIVYAYTDNKVYVISENEIIISPESLYLINPGAVGQPRDGNPMASFIIYDADEWTVKFLRVEYDISAAVNKVIEAGLPERLAYRLTIGW